MSWDKNCPAPPVARNARHACTFVEVGLFIDPVWLVEVEANAVAGV
ncbi:MAG: hypothetical protein ACLPSW_11445 [Roseiarcus sp.]